MSKKLIRTFILTSFFSTLAFVSIAQGQEPGWYPRVIAPAEVRPQIQAAPVEYRPYRPLHFWGNTVRRSYYRGSPLPMPADVLNTGTNLLTPLQPVRPIVTFRLFGR